MNLNTIYIVTIEIYCLLMVTRVEYILYSLYIVLSIQALKLITM